MKKYFLLAVFACGVMTMTSCKKDCCKLLTVSVCEGDEPSGTTWEDYRETLDNSGYNCD
ncbi:MAG: hypothetical protein K9G41_09585 [Flavobacteriales bacterium]|nr:hypothetical protein [Flavobacteriales bacterium]